MTAWLVPHAAFCFYLTGLVWVIQLAHYPAFAWIDEKEFARFHARHTAVMGVIVGPAMVAELATALVLASKFQPVWVVNLLAVAVIWFTTFFRSVPSHNKLAKSRDPDEIRRLVRWNWARTVLWSARSLVFLWLLV